MTESSRVQSRGLAVAFCSSLTLPGPAPSLGRGQSMNLEPERAWDVGSLSTSLRFLIWEAGMLMGSIYELWETIKWVGAQGGYPGLMYLPLLSHL